MNNLKAVILAAGKGTRMESPLPKVLHKISGKPMVQYAIDAAKGAGVEQLCLIVGYGADLLRQEITEDGIEFVVQEEQLGTGHAVKCAKDFIGKEGETLILCGDTPVITSETLRNLVEQHRKDGNGVTVLSTILDDPSGYGRIVRDPYGNFVKSVEHKDATQQEKKNTEVNSGIYIFNSELLSETLDKIKNDNAQGEYYLPDALTIIKDEASVAVDAMIADDANEIQGVNTKEQLLDAEALMEARGE